MPKTSQILVALVLYVCSDSQHAAPIWNYKLNSHTYRSITFITKHEYAECIDIDDEES